MAAGPAYTWQAPEEAEEVDDQAAAVEEKKPDSPKAPSVHEQPVEEDKEPEAVAE